MREFVIDCDAFIGSFGEKSTNFLIKSLAFYSSNCGFCRIQNELCPIVAGFGVDFGQKVVGNSQRNGRHRSILQPRRRLCQYILYCDMYAVFASHFRTLGLRGTSNDRSFQLGDAFAPAPCFNHRVRAAGG